MNQMVFQIQLARRVDTVPLTRDYVVDAERGVVVSRSMAAAE
jgi:cyclopropane-fatty-acyl-phospholipid synthase